MKSAYPFLKINFKYFAFVLGGMENDVVWMVPSCISV